MFEVAACFSYPQTLERILRDHPDSAAVGMTLFNLACLHAAMQDEHEALKFLERASETGFRERSVSRLIRDDPDLDRLRGRPRFDELIASIAGR